MTKISSIPRFDNRRFDFEPFWQLAAGTNFFESNHWDAFIHISPSWFLVAKRTVGRFFQQKRHTHTSKAPMALPSGPRYKYPWQFFQNQADMKGEWGVKSWLVYIIIINIVYTVNIYIYQLYIWDHDINWFSTLPTNWHIIEALTILSIGDWTPPMERGEMNL